MRQPNPNVVEAARGPDGAPAPCTCNHGAEYHTMYGTGRCSGPLDSYGQPCACRSFEYDTEWDELFGSE